MRSLKREDQIYCSILWDIKMVCFGLLYKLQDIFSKPRALLFKRFLRSGSNIDKVVKKLHVMISLKWVLLSTTIVLAVMLCQMYVISQVKKWNVEYL